MKLTTIEKLIKIYPNLENEIREIKFLQVGIYNREYNYKGTILSATYSHPSGGKTIVTSKGKCVIKYRISSWVFGGEHYSTISELELAVTKNLLKT